MRPASSSGGEYTKRLTPGLSRKPARPTWSGVVKP
jgi:hypothetical protein